MPLVLPLLRSALFAPLSHRPLLRLVPLLAFCITALSVAAQGAGAAPALSTPLEATLVVYSDDGDEKFLGSAFLWRDGTVAVTNAHVVGARRQVILRTGSGAVMVARVVALDKARDVAVIAVPGAVLGAGLSPAQAPPLLGDEVYALGAPLQAGSSVTRGIVSALARQVNPAVPVRLIQHDAAVNPGSSGGPLLNAAGRVLGLNSQIADGSRLFVGIGYAIPVAVVVRVIAGDLAPVPVLGLSTRPVDRRIAQALGIEKAGLLVEDATPGGLAGQAGLRPGDVILRAGGAGIVASGDLAMAIDAAACRDTPLDLWRAGEKLRLMLRCAAQSSIGFETEDGTARGVAIIRAYDLPGLGIGLAADGVTITALTPASPAYLAGLDMGDRVLAVNGRAAQAATLATLKITQPVLFLVRRATGRTLHVTVDPWSNGAPLRPLGGANALDPAVVIF
ncbi:S1C family serine protease [Thalassovita taeanensis]|uniref:Serine protease Do n=1 Tax=Thalassovita taeanensis TaxID=657014 RepID=A0A1H9AGU4_9RHOB|nr:trypsin-like peptidase domain-containing protein [Thalassovita taeanensis]SEP75879.1 serine protease Do [Thalassovita taeanensis]